MKQWQHEDTGRLCDSDVSPGNRWFEITRWQEISPKGEKMRADRVLNYCPDCKCGFVQPFKCVTCGAERLYDAANKAQAEEIEQWKGIAAALAEALDKILNMDVKNHALRDRLQFSTPSRELLGQCNSALARYQEMMKP